MKIRVYRAKNNQWTWQLRARNGRIIANAAETYSSFTKARQAALRLSSKTGVPVLYNYEQERGLTMR